MVFLDNSSPPSLSVVIPCYNEAGCLEELHRRVSEAARGQVGESYEIILVNDGSKDATWSLIGDLVRREPQVVGVNLARNYGHQLALSAGLEVCRGNRIFVLDADLQDPPEVLPGMMALMDQGHDVVFGQRTARAGETLFKLLTAKLFYRLLDRMVDVKIPVDTGDFRLMSRRAVDALLRMPERHRFIRGMVSWIGFSQAPLPYEREERFAGSTNYPLGKMLALASDAVTSFSIRPLRLASHLGFVFAFGGLCMLGVVLSSYLTGGNVAGWTSLAALILILGSVQLLVLGILGEYVGRMYIEGKQRPLYFVDQVLRAEASVARSPSKELHEQLQARINER